ncbi:MAG TPA: hypothetical protein VMF07_13860 [Solirubrobacteraceae bacterium]|nr:hypothetical protein [Solirubrobacteraceae bacterium]
MHRKLIVAAAVLAVSLTAAASASAQTTPVPLSFNHFVLDTPATPYAQVVSPSTQPLTITADVDMSTGQFTVQPSDFSAPTDHFTQPLPGSVTIALASPATGQVDPTTGAVTLDADFTATVTLNGDGSCVKTTGPLTLSTAATTPLPGTAFPAGTTGVVTGTGAFGAGWSTLAPGTGTACGLVDPATAGKGGIWISRNISPATALASITPKLSVKAPKRSTVKRGKVAKVKVTLANTGASDTKSVKVCLAAKKPLSPTRSCKTVKKPAKGSKHTMTFKVKTKKAKVRSYKLKLTATGLKAKTVTLKIKK